MIKFLSCFKGCLPKKIQRFKAFYDKIHESLEESLDITNFVDFSGTKNNDITVIASDLSETVVEK